MKITKKNTDIQKTAILLLHCPDKQGLLAIVTEFINKNNGNILYLDQHVDREEKLFYMRVEWELENFVIPKDKIADYFNTLIANKFEMKFELHFSEEVPRMAIFVSKMSHCLFDILARYSAGEWNVEIPLIISNHPDMKDVATGFGIDFYHFPIDKNNKGEMEKEELALLKKYNIDFIVLARYMQIISDDFILHYPNKIINIHHSFLPAFIGARPYHAAYERGVKIIGATSHYVTPELDAGPIIKQEVTHVSHKDTVNDLIAKGRDLEKIVLSKAVNKHIERKILVYNNRTVVFS
jgi:formyltetrahydrofolate deformylase